MHGIKYSGNETGQYCNYRSLCLCTYIFDMLTHPSHRYLKLSYNYNSLITYGTLQIMLLKEVVLTSLSVLSGVIISE